MISVIIPFHNEKETLNPLIESIKSELNRLKKKFEIILIDDASTDGSVDVLDESDNELKILRQRTRLGKGLAIAAGFAKSKGSEIVFMDADLQDDPRDLQHFISALDEGFDLVNGWRRDRNDPIAKTLPSSIFNTLLLKMLLRSPFHDLNCGYKAMKREVLEEIDLYGDNYRFVPLIADQKGFKTTEVVVNHNPRQYGKSKYGFKRLFFGFYDTITMYFIYRFAEKPLHFFGPIGGITFSLGFIVTLWLTIERLFFGVELYKRPLLIAGVLFIIVGIQITLTGILAELLVYLHRKDS